MDESSSEEEEEEVTKRRRVEARAGGGDGGTRGATRDSWVCTVNFNQCTEHMMFHDVPCDLHVSRLKVLERQNRP